MSKRLNAAQKRIAMGTVALLLLASLFPPMVVERRLYVGDGRDRQVLIIRKFIGWDFVGQVDFEFPENKVIPQDPANPSLRERFFERPRPLTIDDLRIGKYRIAFRVLGAELAVLFVLAGVCFFLARSKE